MADPLRWGILGTGNIAGQFAAGGGGRRGTLTAVGSRSPAAAAAFAAAHRIAHHGDYETLLADPTVDAVYISLPNSLHKRWTIAALAAGKHVLCEKPIALDGAEAAEMFDAARRHGRVLVEAFMYRCHPLTAAVQRAVADGAIGQLRLVRTSFCYRTTKIAGNVRFDRTLGGGCLMDVGCYCVNFARMFAGGEPTSVSAAATFHASGVDDGVVGTMAFPYGVLSTFTCNMAAQADNTAYVCGTDGFIEVPVPWKPPTGQAVYVAARGTPPKMDGGSRPTSSAAPPRQTVTVPVDGSLYGIEADAFAAAVLDGVAPFVSEADTLGNMRTLDALRRQIELRFE
jgi:predicted dehydrogenase